MRLSTAWASVLYIFFHTIQAYSLPPQPRESLIVGNSMITAFRIFIVMAALWALYLPGAYGILFAFVTHWSALVDFTIVVCCLILTVAVFIKIPGAFWYMSFIILTTAAVSGFFYHFRDLGESGPLPFEWLNVYIEHVLPLLLLSVIFKIVRKRFSAQPTLTSESCTSRD